MITEQSYEEIGKARKAFSVVSNNWMNGQFNKILVVVSLLSLLQKIRQALIDSGQKLEFSNSDYSCRYPGPVFEIKKSGEEKFLALGLSEEEISEVVASSYYDYDEFDSMPLTLLFKRGDINQAISSVNDQLDRILEHWRKNQEESPHFKLSAEFLIGILPESLAKDIFC